MSERRLNDGTGEIPKDALRDAASPELIERVWLRLDDSVEPVPGARPRQSPVLLWAGAASMLTFVVGIFVGQRLSGEAPAAVAFGAEPQPRSLPASLGDARVDAPVPSLDEQAARPRSRSVLSRRTHRTAPVSSLLEGEELNLSEATESAELPDGAEALPSALLSAVPPGAVPPGAVPSGAVPPGAGLAVAPPVWQRLANAGEYEAALFELSQEGGFEAVLLDASAEQLMLLADVARATGQTQRALAALRRIISEFRADPVAPLAAFSLGNLLERRGDTRGAAQAFAVYRALSPEGDFAEDALVRQMRSAVERGDRDVAEQLAAQYEAGFPDGRRSEEIRSWLDELHDRALASEADAGGAHPEAAEANADAEREPPRTSSEDSANEGDAPPSGHPPASP